MDKVVQIWHLLLYKLLLLSNAKFTWSTQCLWKIFLNLKGCSIEIVFLDDPLSLARINVVMILIWLIVWHYPFLTFHWCYFIFGSVALAQTEEFKIISDVSAKGRVNKLLGRKCRSQMCCNIHWNHLETNGKNTLTYTFSWWQQF